jgi:hypothetical protein
MLLMPRSSPFAARIRSELRQLADTDSQSLSKLIETGFGSRRVQVQRLASPAPVHPLQVVARYCRQTSAPMTVRCARLNAMPAANAAA